MHAESDLSLEEAVAAAMEARDSGDTKSLDPALRRQATLATASRRAAEAEDEQTILVDAARLIAETLDVDACGAGRLTENGGKLRFWFCKTNEAGNISKEVELSATPMLSLAGFALAAGRPVISPNLVKEERFADVFLRKAGMQSALICPLGMGHQSWGALGVFSSQPREFQPEDVLLIDAIAGVVGTSATRKRAEEELARQERLRSNLLETIDALVIELTSEGRIINYNRACQHTTGFAAREVKDRHIWSAFFVPEEVEQVQNSFDRLRNGESPVEFQSHLLTKHGVRRRISWSFCAMRGANGELESLLATGIDVTDRCQLEELLERSQQATDEARRSLGKLMSRIEAGELVVNGDASQPFSEIPEDEYVERRRKPRRAYPYVQLVAPVLDGKLPNRDSFRPVRCKDIAAGGFSFLSATKPNYDNCVAAFGVAPSFTYLMAKVVHSHATDVDGEIMHVVGCQYTGRVDY